MKKTSFAIRAAFAVALVLAPALLGTGCSGSSARLGAGGRPSTPAGGTEVAGEDGGGGGRVASTPVDASLESPDTPAGIGGTFKDAAAGSSGSSSNNTGGTSLINGGGSRSAGGLSGSGGSAGAKTSAASSVGGTRIGGTSAIPSGGALAGSSSAGGATVVNSGEVPPSCGVPNRPCCLGNACKDGGCCVGVECVASGSSCGDYGGTCSNGSCGGCGTLGTPCCKETNGAGACTGPGTTCSTKNICESCGASTGTTCCELYDLDTRTRKYFCPTPGLVCPDASGFKTCESCGKTGNRCCLGGLCENNGCCISGRCTAENDKCWIPGLPDGGGTCTAGRCSKCGNQGQQCCGYVDDLTCVPGLRCTDKVCVNCGGVGEPCCEGRDGADRCRAGAVCSSTSGAGTCKACGDPGQICCAGESCRNGCCFNGKCVADGTDCISGSGVYGQCQGGRCQCGYPGEMCCPYGWSKFGGGECTLEGTLCRFGSSPEKSRCESCGNLGQGCCTAPNQCSSKGLKCTHDSTLGMDTCQKCGDLDQVCCDSYPSCTTPKTTCYGTTSSSVNKCIPCGSAGGPCCYPGAGCDDPGTVCNNGSCTRCGIAGTPCCAGHGCTNGCCLVPMGDNSGATCVGVGTSCDSSSTTTEGPSCIASGTCEKAGAAPCGGLGQACCVRNAYGTKYCSAPGTSCRWQKGSGDTCVPCGDKGQVCCVSRADDGTACKAPYRCVSDKTDIMNEVFLCTDAVPTATGTSTGTSTH